MKDALKVYSTEEVTLFHSKIKEMDVTDLLAEEMSGYDMEDITAEARIDTQFSWPRLVSVEVVDQEEGEAYFLSRSDLIDLAGPEIITFIEEVFVRMNQ